MSAPDAALPSPGITLPISGARGPSTSAETLAALEAVSSATASAILRHLGVRQTFVLGPRPLQNRQRIVGPAVTLQFMPQREDIASGIAQEEIEKQSALWHVLDSIRPGDILMVAAKGDPYSGCLGEMLITYLKGRGAVGGVVDGSIRDWPLVEKIGLPLWVRGHTPNYASQAGLFPWAYNVPVDMANVLVLPGDIVIADDDGTVVIPVNLVDLVLKEALDHEHWEEFSRQRLAEGGSIWTYYPLSEEGRREYERWKLAQG